MSDIPVLVRVVSSFVRGGYVYPKDELLEVDANDANGLIAQGYVRLESPITPLQPEWLDRLVSTDVRSWDFLAEPSYKHCDAGYTIQLSSPMAKVTTATGANKCAEYYEYAHHNPYGAFGGGGDWFHLRHIVKCWLNNAVATNPQGECFAGIELGSFKAGLPWATNYGLNALQCIQLRWNAARSKWEFLICDCEGSAPTVEDCVIQPSLALNAGAELMIDYQPRERVDLYITGQLIHSYKGPRLAEFAVNAGGADAGGGIFVTSGSNAAGKMVCEFFGFKAITVGRKQRATKPLFIPGYVP